MTEPAYEKVSATLPRTLVDSARARADARVPRLPKNAPTERVDADFATEAGQLLGRTGRSDTVDALVATTAIRLNRPTTILTSDPRDLQSLTSDHPLVRVVLV